MQLDTHTMGELTYNAGPESSMSTSIVRDTARTYTSFSLHLGILQSFINFTYIYKMHEKEMKLRGSVRLVLQLYICPKVFLNCISVSILLIIELVHSDWSWNTERKKKFRDTQNYPQS